MVVRDFLSMLDHVCKEVSQQDRTVVGSARSFRMSATTAMANLKMYGQHARDDDDDEDSWSL